MMQLARETMEEEGSFRAGKGSFFLSEELAAFLREAGGDGAETSGQEGAEIVREGVLKIDGEVRMLRMTAAGDFLLHEVAQGCGSEPPVAGDLVYKFKRAWASECIYDQERPKPAFNVIMRTRNSPLKIELVCKVHGNSKTGGVRQRNERLKVFNEWLAYFASVGLRTVPGAVNTKQFDKR